MNVRLQLLRAAILTHNGKHHFAATGDSQLLNRGWQLYYRASRVPGLNGKIASTSLTTAEEFFFAARQRLASR